MTAPANKTQQDRHRPSTVSGRSKPKGKRVSLKQYKANQRAALDKLLREYGA